MPVWLCMYVWLIDWLTLDVFVIDSVFQPVYRKLMPLYYPRSKKEERISLPLLPADIGNSEGEPVVPERQIRIAEKPGNLEGELNNCSM